VTVVEVREAARHASLEAKDLSTKASTAALDLRFSGSSRRTAMRAEPLMPLGTNKNGTSRTERQTTRQSQDRMEDCCGVGKGARGGSFVGMAIRICFLTVPTRSQRKRTGPLARWRFTVSGVPWRCAGCAMRGDVARGVGEGASR
jgi:hypothetical protein